MTVSVPKVVFKAGPVFTRMCDCHEHRKPSELLEKRAMCTRCKRKD